MITEIDFKDLVPKRNGGISNTKNVDALEKEMLKLDQAPCSVTHSFGPGVYIRQVSMPAGSTVIGHHQNFEHVNIFLKGRITFFKDGEPIEMKAPMTFVGKPGRKVAYIHEDSIWLNVYPTNETDIEKLESHYLTKSEISVQDKLERAKSTLLTMDADKNDYLKFLTEFGLTEEKVRTMSENKQDMTALPFGVYKMKTGQSTIEGIGLIATGDLCPGEPIAPARFNGQRTIAGRYTNHSLNPNAKMFGSKSGDIWLVATNLIKGCHGGQDGEEITVDYRKALKLTLEIGGIQCQQ